jgi:hypothetical protein
VKSREERERLGPVRSGQHPVAVGAQVLLRERTGRFLLLGQQDRRLSGGGHVTSRRCEVPGPPPSASLTPGDSTAKHGIERQPHPGETRIRRSARRRSPTAPRCRSCAENQSGTWLSSFGGPFFSVNCLSRQRSAALPRAGTLLAVRDQEQQPTFVSRCCSPVARCRTATYGRSN